MTPDRAGCGDPDSFTACGPCSVIRTGACGSVPWIPTQDELFSMEWQVLEFHEEKPARNKKDS